MGKKQVFGQIDDAQQKQYEREIRLEYDRPPLMSRFSAGTATLKHKRKSFWKKATRFTAIW